MTEIAKLLHHANRTLLTSSSTWTISTVPIDACTESQDAHDWKLWMEKREERLIRVKEPAKIKQVARRR